MASLISWAKKKVKGGVQTVQRDIVNPVAHAGGNVQHTAGNVGHALGNVERVAIAAPRKVGGFAADIAKPVVRTGMAVNQGIGNAELALAGRPTKNASQFFGKNYLGAQKLTGYTGTKRQIAGDVANTALTVATPGIGKGIEKSFQAVAPKIIPRIIPKVVANAGTGAIVGGPMDVANYVSGNRPITKKGVTQSFKQGAQMGAVLGGGGTVAGELASKAAPVVLKASKVGATKIASGAKTVNEKAFTTPAMRVNVNDQRTLRDFSDYLVGANKARGPELNKLIADARAVGKKHGVNLTTGTVKEHIDQSNGILDQIGQKNRAVAQSGKALVTDNGSVIPTLKKLAGKTSPEGIPTDQYSLANADIVRTKSPGMGQDGYTVEDWGHKKRFVSLDDVGENTRNRIHQAETEYEAAKKSSTGPVAPGTRGRVQIAKEQLDAAHHDAIKELGLQDYATTKSGGRTFNSRYSDWLETKYRNTSVDSSTIKDMAANPQKYRKQFEAETSSATKPISSSDTGVGQIPTGQSDLKVSSRASIAPPKPPVATANSMPPIKPPARQLATIPELPGNPNTPGKLGPQGTSRFASKTIPSSQVVSGGVKEKLNAPQYSKQSEKANYTASLGKLKDQGQEQFVTNAQEALNKPHGTISRQEATDAITAAQMLDNANDPASLARASDIYDKLSSHYTAAGQLTQSAAILARRTPQGLLYDATRQLSNVGAQVTPELQAQIKNAVDEFKRAPKAQKDYAAAKVRKIVADNTPQDAIDKLTSVWKAGLLSGVKTQQGNALSNATFAGIKKLSDIPSAAVDKGVSLFTGQRTKTLTARGSLQGAKEGLVNAKGTLKTGIDKRNITEDKYQQHGELNFKNPIINAVFGKTTNLVFRGMSAADQPFYYSAAKNSLYDQAIALAKTKGVSGAERANFVKNAVDNPSQGMAERARAEADKAVLGQDSKVASAVSNFTRKIPGGQIIAPFTKVPTNFISRTLDFTPIGIGKGAVKVIQDVRSGKGFDQRALSEAIGEGLTGSGAIALGYALSNKNLISGDYPKNDPKEAQRWKAEGITPNSVKVGNKWISLNYIGPLGLLFNAGHQMQLTSDSGATASVGSAVGGLGQGLLGQSFLQGFSGVSDAISNPEQNAKNYINSQVSSVVPAWLNDIANASDSSQRQADSVPEAVKNKIPGLRETNKVKQDVYGNNLAQAAGRPNTLNGLKPSNSLTNRNSVITEVARLHSADPNNKDLQVTPTAVGKTLTVEKSQVKLNDSQRYALQSKVGQATQKTWGDLIKTPEYKALDNVDKAKALSDLRTDVNTQIERQYVTDNNLGIYSKSPSKSVIALGEGSANLADYATKTQDSSLPSNATPAQKYKDALSKYNSNKGKMSDVQKYATESSLAKMKVAKDYSSDVVSLYGLSKTKLSDFLTTNKNGKSLYEQLKKYDQAQLDAGLITTSKFKYGLESSKSSGGSAQSSKGKALLATLRYNDAIKAPQAPNVPKPGKLAAARQVALKKYTPKQAAISKSTKISVHKNKA